MWLRQRDGTAYNEELKQAYTKANHVSKGKIQKSGDKAEEIAQTRGWLLFQVVV